MNVRVFRRRDLAARLSSLFVLSAALTMSAHAQDAYPSRQITLIAPYAAGGSTDLVARILSEGLKAKLNQPVLVENKPGGSGAIGTREVIKANPDGHTLLIGSVGAQVTPVAMSANPAFDPVRDLVPVARTAEWVGVMCVKKSLPVQSLQEFLAYAKARQGELNFGSSGYGSLVHLIGEVFMKQTGIRMQHVPYRGGSNSMTDLMVSALDVLFVSSPVAVGQVGNKDLKMLAVASERRLKFLADVPTFAEAGVEGVDQTSWMGVFGPPGLPQPVRTKLSDALVEIVSDPDTQAKLQRIGFAAAPADSAAFDAFYRNEVKRWFDFVRERGLMER